MATCRSSSVQKKNLQRSRSSRGFGDLAGEQDGAVLRDGEVQIFREMWACSEEKTGPEQPSSGSRTRRDDGAHVPCFLMCSFLWNSASFRAALNTETQQMFRKTQIFSHTGDVHGVGLGGDLLSHCTVESRSNKTAAGLHCKKCDFFQRFLRGAGIYFNVQLDHLSLFLVHWTIWVLVVKVLKERYRLPPEPGSSGFWRSRRGSGPCRCPRWLG